MNELRTTIDNHGKILIPAKLRKIMQIKPSDTLIVSYIDGQLKIQNQKNILKQIQADFKNRVSPEKSAVEEFLETKQEKRDIEKTRENKNEIKNDNS